MLPSFQRLHRPLIMHPIRRRDVHNIHVVIIQQVLIRAVGFGKAVCFLGFLGFGEVAGGDGVEDYGGVGFGGMDDLLLNVSVDLSDQ